MGHYHNPQIPTRNLHFLVDAGNSRSYAGSGTVWSDIAGSNSLIASGTQSFTSVGATSYFSFGAANTWFSKTSVNDGVLIQGPITVNVFFNPDTVAGVQNFIAVSSGATKALQIGIRSNGGVIWNYGAITILNYQYTGDGTPCHLTYTCDGSNNSKVYINGVLQSSGTVAVQTGTADDYSIATYYNTGLERCTAKIYYASIHKTVFTDLEVHKTWAALKKRWGFGAIGGTTASTTIGGLQGGLQGGQ